MSAWALLCRIAVFSIKPTFYMNMNRQGVSLLTIYLQHVDVREQALCLRAADGRGFGLLSFLCFFVRMAALHRLLPLSFIYIYSNFAKKQIKYTHIANPPKATAQNGHGRLHIWQENYFFVVKRNNVCRGQ